MESETLSNQDNSEQFRTIELETKEPDGIHQAEIIFADEDTRLVTVYNISISEVCNTRNNFGLFHQTGRGNSPGFHAWEVLGSSTDSKGLQKLFPLIHDNAKETYLKFKQQGLFT